MSESNFNLKYLSILLIIFSLLFSSCEKMMINEKDTCSNIEVFEELWSTIDQRYSMFGVKNVDWDYNYLKYKPLVNESLRENQLLLVLGEMIKELKDSHTDITTGKAVVYYWPLNEDYMQKFNFTTIKSWYLLLGSKEFNAVTYGKIDNIGYVYIKNFKEEISEEDVSKIYSEFSSTKGLIFDVRNNTGGNEQYANNIIRPLLKQPIINKIIKFKKDKEHDSFITINNTLDPGATINYKGEIVVLTNKVTYSSANSFTNTISLLPNVTLIGDTTGGGGSLPLFYELSNGWVLRYSSSIEYRPSDSLVTEKGIPPNYYINQIKSSKSDNVLDFALNYLNNN